MTLKARIQSFFARSELTRLLASFRPEFVATGTFSLVVNLLMLVPSLYMLQLYDRVMISQNEFTLIALSLIVLFLYMLSGFTEWLRARLLVRVGVLLDERLNQRVFLACQGAYLRGRTNPSQAFSDLTQIRQFLVGQGIFAFFDTPWTIVYLVVLFLLHPWLGLLGILFVCIQGLISWQTHRRTHAASDATITASLETQNFLAAKLKHMDTIRAMGMQDGMRKQWLEKHGRQQALVDHVSHDTHRMLAAGKLVRYAQQTLALAVGALLVIQGQLTAASMVAANILMTRALQPIEQVAGSWRLIDSIWAAFLRLENLLREVPEAPPGGHVGTPSGAVSIEALSVKIPGRTTPILNHIDLAIPAGSLVGIVGASGAGKTTLLRCLLGICFEAEGRILIDGIERAAWNRQHLGAHIGYLPQDVELLEGTIAENIARFNEPDANKILAAAQMAGVHEMILRLPNGYDTPVGERGHTLSGGQRQRIGLARALYGDPALILLDEPNANLDEAGDIALTAALAQLKQHNRTVLIVTHRMAILNNADRLLVLSAGSVQAYGTRTEVIQRMHPAGNTPAMPNP